MSIPLVLVGMISWHHGRIRIFPYRVAGFSPHVRLMPFPYNWFPLDELVLPSVSESTCPL